MRKFFRKVRAVEINTNRFMYHSLVKCLSFYWQDFISAFKLQKDRTTEPSPSRSWSNRTAGSKWGC